MPTNAFDVITQGFQQQAADTQDMARLQLQVALNQWEQKKRAEEAVLADARDLDRQLKVAKENARLQAEAQRRAKEDTGALEFNRQLFELGRDKANHDFDISRDSAKSREAEARFNRDRKTRSEMAAANVVSLRKTAQGLRESAINDLATVRERARNPITAEAAVRSLVANKTIDADKGTVLMGLVNKAKAGDPKALDAFQNQLNAYADNVDHWYTRGDPAAIRSAFDTAIADEATQLHQAALVNMQLVDNSIRDYDRQAAEEGQYILPEHRALIEPAKPADSSTGAQPTGAPKSEADRFKAVMGGAAASNPQQQLTSSQQPVAYDQLVRMQSPNQGISGIAANQLEYEDGAPTPLRAAGTVATLRESEARPSAMQTFANIATGGIYKPDVRPTALQGNQLASALTQYLASMKRGDTATAQQIGSAIEEFRSRFSGGQHEPLTVQNAQQALAALQQQAAAVQ